MDAASPPTTKGKGYTWGASTPSKSARARKVHQRPQGLVTTIVQEGAPIVYPIVQEGTPESTRPGDNNSPPKQIHLSPTEIEGM